MKFALKTFCAVLIALAAFLAFAGYFDGDMLLKVPATATTTPAHERIAAVYFSGDIGYKMGMGRKIGNYLATDGIPVVAVNSLGFFRPHRSVAEVAELTARAIREALAFGHTDQVVLIGHSFGADALQAGLAQLPQDLRAKVRAVVLIVPTKDLFLRISPGEMLDLIEPDGKVLPTLTKLTWVPVTCIYGTKETESPCPQLISPNVQKAELPGGHALEWNIAKIHSVILHAINASSRSKVTKVSEPDHLTAMRQQAH